MTFTAVAIHSSQMKAFDPATSLFTSSSLLPQNEHFRTWRLNMKPLFLVLGRSSINAEGPHPHGFSLRVSASPRPSLALRAPAPSLALAPRSGLLRPTRAGLAANVFGCRSQS